jgi:hypothetical protein
LSGSRLSQQRLNEVVSYYHNNGEEATAEYFNIKRNTIERYLRRSREQEKNPVKILIFDLETAPMEAEIWHLRQERITPDWIIKPTSLLTWSAKWLYDDEIHYGYVTPRAASQRKDKKIIKTLWKLLNEADIVMAHNLVNFDRKVFNTRCIVNGIEPPSPYKMIDTLKEARKEFKFASNKLDYLTQLLVNNKKISTSGSLWRRCVRGKKEDAEKAIQEMLTYNKHDVVILEDLYLKIRPWIRNHPNLGIYYNNKSGRCPNCGSKEIKLTNKYYYGTIAKYKTIRCKSCGTPYGRKRYQSQENGMIMATAR